MSGNLESRLRKLESASGSSWTPCRRIIGRTVAECEATMAAMVSANQASDRFIYRLIVAP